MRIQRQLALLILGWATTLTGAEESPHPVATKAVVVETCTLPRTSLSRLSNPALTDDVLATARGNGLKFSDLLSLGSGLAKVGTNEFVGITDRGPNGIVGERRTFPLPQFCPTIVRFKLADGKIITTETIPLTDSQGKRLTGLSNTEGDERLYETADAATPLPFDPNGIDPEGIRVLPGGNFLLCEEYAPSLLVVSPQGRMLMRYTPESKPLTNATYPVQAILPAVFAKRRANHGFESVAVSADGRFAYAILQSSMGDENDPRFADSRVVRVLKLDIGQPLAARVVGEYLLLTSPATDYSPQQKQSKVTFSDAEWVAPEKLLMLERGKGLVKLLQADFSGATNVLGRKYSGTLIFEAKDAKLRSLGIQPVSTTEVFSTRDVPGITADKLEGLALISPAEIAIANDNDFGLGDNTTGEPTRVWILRLDKPLTGP